MKAEPLFASIIKSAIEESEHKAVAGGRKNPTLKDVKRHIDVVLAHSPEVRHQLKEARRELSEESRWVTNARGALRPVISLILSIAFIILLGTGCYTIIKPPQVDLSGLTGLDSAAVADAEASIVQQLKAQDTDRYNRLKDLLTLFVAVYGPILGFWFGEHTAMKGREEEVEARSAMEKIALHQSGIKDE